MKTKVVGLALFALTLGAVLYYPSLSARHLVDQDVDDAQLSLVAQKPVVDVVFVLDTTGSMSGLIDAAKEKIWSIATTMSAAKPTPEIRIGLVAYRDRGDAYVTRIVNLSSDLDSVYAALMDFQADGGGDGPESVNKALYDAVHQMAWSEANQAYQVIFLVGDAPPHMDYQDEVQYPEILAAAAGKGIVVNTIQCGTMTETIQPWTQIASLGRGNYFQVEQAGSAVAMSTPYDEELATLSARLDETRLYYGTAAAREKMAGKMAATEKLHEGASLASRAGRGAFNSGEAGKDNFLGENELVEAVANGTVKLDELDKNELPEALKPMAPEAQAEYVADLARERKELSAKVRVLADARSDYMKKKVEESGGARDSLDQKIYDTVSRQAEVAGLVYEDGPAY